MLAIPIRGAVMYYEIDGTNVRIMGSVHKFPAAASDPPKWIEGAYGWANRIVVEVNPDPAVFQRRARFPAGDRLSNHLSVATVARLNALWAGTLAPAEVEEIKPWAHWVSLIDRLMPLSPGVEQLILPSAIADRKSVIEIETNDEQAAALDSLPSREVEDVLAYGLSDLTRASNNFFALHRAWAARDPAALLRVVAVQPSFRGSLGDILIRQRNANWVPRLMPHLSSLQRTLVIVGALHLVGPENVLDGLSAASGLPHRVLP
jgi:uncharacterized protein